MAFAVFLMSAVMVGVGVYDHSLTECVAWVAFGNTVVIIDRLNRGQHASEG